MLDFQSHISRQRCTHFNDIRIRWTNLSGVFICLTTSYYCVLFLPFAVLQNILVKETLPARHIM